jgi:hypothetical protein
MATRKVKRYNGEEDGSFVEAGSGVADTKEAGMSEKEPGWDTKEAPKEALKAAAKPAPKPAPKPESKPAASPQSSGVTRMSKEAGEAAQAKFREDAKPAPKKEYYRTLGGKMAEKTPDTDRFKNFRETIGSGLKSAGEGFGNYLKSLGQREEKHGTYVKDGKVVKYAKGGSASSRADGIATKGKTRGKIC